MWVSARSIAGMPGEYHMWEMEKQSPCEYHMWEMEKKQSSCEYHMWEIEKQSSRYYHGQDSISTLEMNCGSAI